MAAKGIEAPRAFFVCFSTAACLMFLCCDQSGGSVLVDAPDQKTAIKRIKDEIFSAEETAAEAKSKGFYEVSPPFWAPTDSDINELEQAVRSYLFENEGRNKVIDFIRHNRSDYSHQYFGYSTGGRRMVLRNSYCRRAPVDRSFSKEKRAVIVDGGGACFYRIRYDTKLKKVVGFEANLEEP